MSKSCRNEKELIKILSLSVCGLQSKLIIPEFVELINNHNIIGLQETKLDDADTPDIKGYKLFCNNRQRLSRYRSGGTALLIREELLPHIKVHKPTSKLIQWFNISSKVTNTHADILCGIIYVPPHRSRYSSEDPNNEIQMELNERSGNSKHIILFGDLNSRTSNSADFIRTDEFISHVNNDDILTYENEEISYCFEYNNVPLKRKSADTSTNAYGYQMLDFCKSNDLVILNGRFGEDKISPKLTCKDSSTVDYFISSAYNFAHTAALKVFDFSPLYSDAHCPITLHIGKCPQTIPPYKEINACITPKMKMKLWDKEKKDLFTKNLNRSFIADTDARLNVLLSAENVTVSDISSVMNDINDTFLNTCETTFGFSKSTPHKIDKPFRPWFNAECHQARNAYNKIRRLYNKNKTLHNKNMLKNLNKGYKNTL